MDNNPTMNAGTVVQVYRQSVKIGEDFTTIESDICVRVDATDEEIAQAVATSTRIYEQQSMAVGAQVAQVRSAGAEARARAARSARATDRQTRAIANLVQAKGLDPEKLADLKGMVGIPQDGALNRGQASALIAVLQELKAGEAPELAELAQTTKIKE
jgi:hypothetical protein